MAVDRWLLYPHGQTLYAHHPEPKSTKMEWDGVPEGVMMGLVATGSEGRLGGGLSGTVSGTFCLTSSS